MPKLIQATATTFHLAIVGTFVTAIIFVGAGIWLVYLGATGETNFSFFGQKFGSTNVGVAALFLGAATVVLLLRKSLSILDSVVRTESASSGEPWQAVNAWPAAKSQQTLSRALTALSDTQWEILEAVAQSEGALKYTIVGKTRAGPSEFHYRLAGLVEDDFVVVDHDKVHLSEDVHRVLRGQDIRKLRALVGTGETMEFKSCDSAVGDYNETNEKPGTFSPNPGPQLDA